MTSAAEYSRLDPSSDVKIELPSFNSQKNKIQSEKFIPLYVPIDHRCPFTNPTSNRTIEAHLSRCFVTDRHIAYVVARLVSQSDSQYFADARTLQEKIRSSQNQPLTLPGTGIQIKKIEYFVTKVQTTPFHWVKLQEVLVTNNLEPNPFMDSYLYCSSNPVPTDELLIKRHDVIEYLHHNNNNLDELYYWLKRTGEDFPHDRWTLDLLEQLFELYPDAKFEGKADFKYSISQLKCLDAAKLISLTVKNLLKLGIGAAIQHFAPKEALFGIFGGYWIGRFITWKCCSPNHAPYKIANAFNTIFMGAFAGESVEGAWKMIKSPVVADADNYLEVVASASGMLSVIVDLTCRRKRSDFENIIRCRNICSNKLYIS